MYVNFAFDVVESVDCVLVVLAPVEFVENLTYGARRVVAFVVARLATVESSAPSDKSCLSRLVFSSPVEFDVDGPVYEDVVVETFVFGVVSACDLDWDIAEC